MSGFVVDFGVPTAGEAGQTATGTNQATAFVLTKSVTVFSSVPSGTGCICPSSYASGATLTVCNRDPSNTISWYPATGDQIEAASVNLPITIPPGGNVTMISFASAVSRSPRVWYETESYSKGGYLPLAGGTLTGPLTFDTWTTVGRPAVPATGMTGWNTTLGYLESWNGSVWGATPGASTYLPIAGGSFAAYSATALNNFYSVPPSTTVTLTVGSDVANIDAAFTAIQQWVIPLSSSVVIVLPTGLTSRSTPIVVDHPYGARITLQGASPASTTATAAGAVTGATNAWAVPLTVVSATNISVGDYALIRNVTGTGQFRLFSGICRVASVVGTTVTVTNTARNAAWPTAALTGADVMVLKTRLVFTGCDGIQVDGPLGLVTQMALIGNQTAGTIGLISQRTSSGNKAKGLVFCSTSFGISGFGDGGIYAMYAGTVVAPSVCVANCNVYCVYGQQGGAALVDNGVFSGCVETGIGSASSGAVSAQGALAVGNGLYGVFAFQGGAILFQDGFAWSNVNDGIRAAWGGSVRGTTIGTQFNGGNGVFVVGADVVITGSTISSNAGVGAYAEGGGSIYASGSAMSSNGSYGAYADGGVVDMPSATTSSNTINGVTATNNGTILAASLAGTGNGTYLASANRGGTVRVTSATTGGATLFADTGGLIDATSASGSPVLSYGSDGIIIAASTIRGGMLLVSTANIAIGATSTTSINVDRATTAGLRFARSATLKAYFGIDDGASIVVGAADGDTVIRSAQALWFAAGGANPRGFIDALGNAAMGKASLATTATDGFFYFPTCAGVPTGVPTAKAGYVAVVGDSVGQKLYAYFGAWMAQT